jgi:hypothetical protein
MNAWNDEAVDPANGVHPAIGHSAGVSRERAPHPMDVLNLNHYLCSGKPP